MTTKYAAPVETHAVVSARIPIELRDRLIKQAEKADMTNCEFFGKVLEKGASK